MCSAPLSVPAEPTRSASLAEVLDAVEPHACSRLLEPGAWARMRSLAAELPAVSTAGFELTLGQGQRRADFALRATSHELRRMLGRLRSVGPDPAWARIEALMGELLEPERVRELRYDRIHELWLELDLARETTGSLVPAVFMGLARWDTDAEELRAGTPASVVGALRHLGGAELPANTLAGLERCFTALRPEQHVLQVGAMLSRPERGLRVVARGFDRAGALAYLRRIGWPGELLRVGNELAGLLPRCERVALSIDVGSAVGPRLGLEASPSLAWVPGRDPRCAGLLDHFVARGLCSAGEAEGLLAWGGRTTWGAVSPGLERLGLPVPSIARGINHFKLVLEPEREPFVKAYFGVHLGWSRRGRPL